MRPAMDARAPTVCSTSVAAPDGARARLGALCRNPQKAECVDLPAILVYRDALDQEQRVRRIAHPGSLPRGHRLMRVARAVYVLHGRHARHAIRWRKHAAADYALRTIRQYEQYLLKEYLAYRIYAALSSNSLRVRLAHVTYRDSAGRLAPFERYAFFTEHFDSFARRHGVVVRSKQLFIPRTADPNQLTCVPSLQYAIGNTDWSAVKGHNVSAVASAGWSRDAGAVRLRLLGARQREVCERFAGGPDKQRPATCVPRRLRSEDGLGRRVRTLRWRRDDVLVLAEK